MPKKSAIFETFNVILKVSAIKNMSPKIL